VNLLKIDPELRCVDNLLLMLPIQRFQVFRRPNKQPVKLKKKLVNTRLPCIVSWINPIIEF